jgi:hypothetical protein
MHDVTCTKSGCEKKNPAGKKFCSDCGSVLPTATALEETVGATGHGVKWGTWGRAPGDFLAQASLEDMRPFFGKSNLTVPRNAVGLVVLDGSLMEVASAGQTLEAGWLKKMGHVFTGKLDRTQFYLIDLRPLFQVLGMSDVQDGVDVQKQIVVSFQLNVDDMRSEATDKTAMTSRFWTFLEREHGGAPEVSRDDILKHIHGSVESVLETWRNQVFESPQTAEAQIARAVQEDVASEMGFMVSVRIRTVGKTHSSLVTVGNAPLPVTRPCGECGAATPTSQPFCSACGKEQAPLVDPSSLCGSAECRAPVVEGKKFCTACGAPAPGPVVRIHKADGHQIQVEVALRYDGGHAKDESKLTDALGSIVMRLVRDRSYDDLISSTNWPTVSDEVTQELSDVAAKLGIQSLQAELMDMTSKSGEWKKQFKAELLQEEERVRQGHEWAKVDRDKMEVQKLAFDLAIENLRLRQGFELGKYQAERDGLLEEHKLVLDGQLEEHKLDTEHGFEKDSAGIADLQRRQSLADADSDMRIASAQRGARTDIAVDAAQEEAEAAQRKQSRAVADEAYADALTDGERQQMLQAQSEGFDRSNEADDLQHQSRVETASSKLEQELERSTATHDATLAREAAELGADTARTGGQADADIKRLSAQADADINRLSAQADADGYKAGETAKVDMDERKQGLDLDRQAKEQDLALSGESRRHEMAMDEEARRDQRKKEQMRMLAENESMLTEADSAKEIALTEANSAKEIALTEANSAKEVARLEQLKGESMEQIMAMQGSEVPEYMAAALETKFGSEAAQAASKSEAERASSGDKEALYKQMLEMQQQLAASGNKDMKEMVQMMMQAQQNASVDKQAAAAEGKQDTKEMLQMMMQSQQQAGAAQSSAADATLEAYKGAAQQAQAISESSMSNMAQVAAEKARTAATKEVHKEVHKGTAAVQSKPAPASRTKTGSTCQKCGVASDDPFCGECGHQM